MAQRKALRILTCLFFLSAAPIMAAMSGAASARTAASSFSPPKAIPKGKFGDVIRLGEEVFDHTQTAAKDYVGNGLVCENCHLDRGRLANSAPMWAAFVSYPKYRSKNGKVVTLEDRIRDCFRFSMNGQPPKPDSKQLVALVSYFYWLGTGAPLGAKLAGAGYPRLPKPRLVADPDRGAAVYQAHCALCHGAHGAGRKAGGAYVFPPLWGPESFNWGAGMHQVDTAAGFIKTNMPLGLGGSLANQQAWDVAAFVDSHPRPQDPRFTGSVGQTRQKYHNSSADYYGQVVHGVLLGASNR
ncbi:MAG TPA: c-type cytochrome [Beijerinckiaceae bacterium]|nr:c-type cytochrome [Beijerinckiaceae bacterium]